jgi:hypothetical protein
METTIISHVSNLPAKEEFYQGFSRIINFYEEGLGKSCAKWCRKKKPGVPDIV